jgi:hypothetical protein
VRNFAPDARFAPEVTADSARVPEESMKVTSVTSARHSRPGERARPQVGYGSGSGDHEIESEAVTADRQQYTAEKKTGILTEYGALDRHGKGKLLKREGL